MDEAKSDLCCHPAVGLACLLAFDGRRAAQAFPVLFCTRRVRARHGRDPQTRSDSGVRRRRLQSARRERTKIAFAGAAQDAPQPTWIDPIISVHHGRVVKRTGDGSIIEFRSVVDAVRFAVEVQTAMIERKRWRAAREAHRVSHWHTSGRCGRRERRRASWAKASISPARLQSVAKPGGICLSEDAYRHVKEADLRSGR